MVSLIANVPDSPASADPFARADAEARAALTLLMAGDEAAGIARYRACFDLDHVHRLPLGLHIHLLDSAGRDGAATALRQLAVRYGGNVAIRHVALGAPPQEAIAEYEDLIARGIVNARMLFTYLKLLSDAGRAEELRSWLAPDRLFRTRQLDPAFAAEVEARLLAREETAPFQEREQSVRNMRMIAGLDHDPDPVVARLMALLTAEVKDYMRDWAGSGHRLAALVPAAIRLRGWGLVSRGEGSNARHVHPKGWATGIYYPTSVPGDGGALCVGAPAEGDGAAQGWFEAEVRPQAGLLVLMPSFYPHWTTPLGGPGLRTCVAFDVRVLDAEDEAHQAGIDAGGEPL